MSREAFERWYAEAQREPNVRRYADGNGVYTHLAMQSAWLGWQAAQAQVSDEVLAELDKLSNRNYELRMENTELKSKLQGIPVAVRFGWDGEGYQYMDNGSGSDWKTRIPDAELLYAHPQPAQAQAVDGEAVELPEIYEQYRTWPEDIKRKLSLHDLRRMTGWKLHCCNPFQTVNQQLLDDIVNLLIAARGAIKLGSDVNATNYISAAIAAAQEGE